MGSKFFTLVIGVLVLTITSCQKEYSSDNGGQPPVGNGNQPPPPNGKLYRIQQGVDPDLNNDTVYNISYNSTGKIRSIVDSLYQDSILATYDPSRNLTSITEASGDNAFYTYDVNGLLTEIKYKWRGSKEKFVFAYNNGIVAAKGYYSDLGSGGAEKLVREFRYTVTGGNITDIMEFTPSGTLVATHKLAFGTQLNPFKELSLFNYANRLGMGYLIDFETYFNKNILTSSIPNGGNVPDVAISYTFNSQELPSKAVAADASGRTYTWQFYY